MRKPIAPWLLIGVMLVGLVVFRGADFIHRLIGPDLVAQAFAEGGDDPYYYFTVARNLGHGLGFTIDGVNSTTGFQPLWAVICGMAFALAPDRGALALIYVLSFACWLGGAWLFVHFVRVARGGALEPLAAVLIAALFLCEAQLGQSYFNGMETGFYLTLTLALLVAFQHHQKGGPANTTRLVGLGALAGITMLARNDAVFLCGALLAVLVVSGTRPRPVREALIIGSAASLVVLPWLAFCLWAFGHPMPQSGIATSAALRGPGELRTVAEITTISIVPLIAVKLRGLIEAHLLPAIAATLLAAAALALAWRRDREARIDRPSRLALIGLAAANAFLLVYYPIFSSAAQFFERYFSPLKLLVLILLAFMVARLIERLSRQKAAAAAACMAAVLVVGSSVYWTWRDFNLPFRGYIGETAYAIVRSPYAGNGARLGFAESGRIGFLYPDRVVNLDGKMRIDALNALRDGSFAHFVQAADLDFIVLHGFDTRFFDKVAPGWNTGYQQIEDLGSFFVYARRR
jgi:hypothetical protein